MVKDSCVYQFECLIISKYQFEVYTQSLDMQIVRLAEQLLYRDGQELYKCDIMSQTWCTGQSLGINTDIQWSFR